jgi:large subunit ribosomal protein L32
MPTPKKKTSRSRRNMRRSHDGLDTPAMAMDKKTKEWVRPHTAYKAADGALYYKGRQLTASKNDL